MRTDVEVEGVVGKITRTAAGTAATLTTVWQEFKFQLCTTLLFCSSPSTQLCFFLPDDICMTDVKFSIYIPICSSSSCLSFSVSLLHVPFFPFAKTTIYT